MRAFVVPSGDDALDGLLTAAAQAAGHEVLPPPGFMGSGHSDARRGFFTTVVDRLHEADLLVAHANPATPSGAANAAWSAAWFLVKGRLVVAAVDEDALATASAMLVGNPSPWQRLVGYRGDADALTSAMTAALRF